MLPFSFPDEVALSPRRSQGLRRDRLYLNFFPQIPAAKCSWEDVHINPHAHTHAHVMQPGTKNDARWVGGGASRSFALRFPGGQGACWASFRVLSGRGAYRMSVLTLCPFLNCGVSFAVGEL